MIFEQVAEPDVSKPIVIAAMQDMGSVGSIVIDHINRALGTRVFRTARPDFPSHVIDSGGHVEVPDETWKYRYADGIIVFGGGRGQPQGDEMGRMCQDVVDVAKRHSARFVYTAGGYNSGGQGPGGRTYVTTTSEELTRQMTGIGMRSTPGKSAITGFNGIILGVARQGGLHGIGLYGEVERPDTPQYGAAAGILRALERLTYRRIGDVGELESMAGG